MNAEITLLEVSGYFFVYVGDKNVGWVASSLENGWWGNPYQGDGDYHMVKFSAKDDAVAHVVANGQ